MTRKFETVARKEIGRALGATQAKRCTAALMDLLGARMAIGGATAEAHWWDDHSSRLPDLFRAHTEATLAFERACLLPLDRQ